MDGDTLPVCCADKLYTARAIAASLRTQGLAMLSRFSVLSRGTAWYCGALAAVFI